jgi:hypothetical protein
MMPLRIKKPILKKVPHTQWVTEYRVGDLIIYNPFLEGYIKPGHYYKWELITKEEVEKNAEFFEEVME